MSQDLYQYFDQLDAVTKVSYKKKISIRPYKLPEGVWENNPTKGAELEWEDVYSYLFENCISLLH